MRTLTAGTRVVRRAPIAAVPIVAESFLVALLIAFGALPRTGASAAAGAVFPLTIYFDLKQALAHAPAWPYLVAAAALSLIVRSAVVASTLWLVDGRNGSLLETWFRAARALLAFVSFIPAAVLYFTGTVIRYAPFLWLAAIVGLIPALIFCRKAVRIDAGIGAPLGGALPELPAFMSYAYMLAAVAAALSVLGRVSFLLVALLVACLGPIQALLFLGWRDHVRRETYPGGGVPAIAVTVVALVGLAGATVYDRLIADRPPVARVEATGTLLILGGADSTSGTGALSDLDPREVGFGREQDPRALVQGSGGSRYAAADTRADLDEIAEIVAAQIESTESPRDVLGHSQAASILDRIEERDLADFDRAVVISGSPPIPPVLDVTAPGEAGDGAVGSDAARAMRAIIRGLGLPGYDIDAPAAPTSLEPVVLGDRPVRTFGDLGGGRLGLARYRLAPAGRGERRRDVRSCRGDEQRACVGDGPDVPHRGEMSKATSPWRGVLVSVVRYAFEPWRPG